MEYIKIMSSTYSSDADLLLLPISTLDYHQRELAQQIDILSDELHSILKAKETRRTLKRNNNVAVRLLVRDVHKRIVDIVITTMPLSDAIKRLESDCIDSAGRENFDTHIILWTTDGYLLNMNDTNALCLASRCETGVIAN